MRFNGFRAVSKFKAAAVVACLASLLAGPARAERGGITGVGLLLGDPIGPTVKYWLSSTAAVNVGLGFNEDFAMYADYQWHVWDLFRQPRRGRLAGYFGVGALYEDIDDRNADVFGFRTMGGASYWVEGRPIELYAELGPVFEVSPEVDVDANAGIGFRFYFE